MWLKRLTVDVERMSHNESGVCCADSTEASLGCWTAGAHSRDHRSFPFCYDLHLTGISVIWTSGGAMVSTAHGFGPKNHDLRIFEMFKMSQDITRTWFLVIPWMIWGHCGMSQLWNFSAYPEGLCLSRRYLMPSMHQKQVQKWYSCGRHGQRTCLLIARCGFWARECQKKKGLTDSYSFQRISISSYFKAPTLEVKSWRWSVFQEALREVSGSQHLRRKTEMSAMSASTSLGDMIMEGKLIWPQTIGWIMFECFLVLWGTLFSHFFSLFLYFFLFFVGSWRCAVCRVATSCTGFADGFAAGTASADAISAWGACSRLAGWPKGSEVCPKQLQSLDKVNGAETSWQFLWQRDL